MVVQIASIDTTLIGKWVVGQVGTLISRIMYKIKFRIGDIIFRDVLMILCEMLLRTYFINTSSIDLLGSGRGRVSGLGDAL